MLVECLILFSVPSYALKYQQDDKIIRKYNNLCNVYVMCFCSNQANPKFIPASKMNQIMEAKWREFEANNPFKGEGDKEEEEEGDEDDDEEKDEDDAEVRKGGEGLMTGVRRLKHVYLVFMIGLAENVSVDS